MAVRLTILRLVLASPSDVESEWSVVRRVVGELNDGLAEELGFRLAIANWRTDTYPGFHVEGPQGQVDATLRIEDSDLLVAIFWTHFGTPVADAESGTQHEILRAIAAWKSQGKPQVMVYFKTAPYAPKGQQELEQWAKVRAFRDNFPEGGLWGSFGTKPQFETQLRRDLTNVIRARKAKVRRSQPTRTLATAAAEGATTEVGTDGSANMEVATPLDQYPKRESLNQPEGNPIEESPPLHPVPREPQRESVAIASNVPVVKGDSLFEATFRNTAWHIGCRKCREKSRWVRLREDGMIEFRFGNDNDFRFEGDDTWRVEGNQLLLSWRSGYSVERFTFLESTQTTATGTSTNVRGPLRITRLQ